MPRIFLSYATPDRERALAVKVLLEIGGGEVFMDCYKIPYGSDWRAVIEQAVNECDVMCVFWSRHTPRSMWVEREYSTFMRGHPERPCVPLCADETPLPGALAARQAPPFLELTNQFLALRGRLRRQGVSRRETKRLVELELEASGVRINGRQKKQLLKLFVGGISIFALLTWFFEIVPKWKLALAAGLCVAGAFAAHETCTAGDQTVPTATPARPAAATPVPTPASTSIPVAAEIDASLPLDTSHEADAHDPDCLRREPYIVRPKEVKPVVEHTEDPLCALLAKLYPASDRGFVGIAVEPGVAYRSDSDRTTPAEFPICDDAVQYVHWASSIGFEPFQCDIDMRLIWRPRTAVTASVVFKCSKLVYAAHRSAELARLRDSFERCLTRSDGWEREAPRDPEAIGADFSRDRWRTTLRTEDIGNGAQYRLSFDVRSMR
ncbi:MAG TPA: toll/interleukin-1 receptor domain-containing protein [Kofleriaceae bacterium]